MKNAVLLTVLVLCLLLASCKSDENNVDEAFETVYFNEAVDTPDYNEQEAADMLLKLGVFESDFERTENVTTLNALKLFERILAANHDIYDVSIASWYVGDTLSSIDDIDDDTKMLLLRLSLGSGNYEILDYNEILNLDLDGDITQYEALLYISRLVGSTYGCTDTVIDNADVEIDDIYKFSYESGIISSDDTSSANSTLTYHEFLDMVGRAFYVKYSRGGYGGVSYTCLINELKEAYDNSIKSDNQETETERKMIELDPSEFNVRIDNDLSVIWRVPDKYASFQYDHFKYVDFLNSDGEIVGRVGSGLKDYGNISGEDMALSLYKFAEKKPTVMRISYHYAGSNDEYYFDVDISKISFVSESLTLKPGVYTCKENTWPIKSLTLDNGYIFEKDCYYVLKAYEHKYRKSEYNGIYYDCFKANENGSSYVPPSGKSVGVTPMDDIHIQRIKVSGNSEIGFTLYLSTESKNAFTISEVS